MKTSMIYLVSGLAAQQVAATWDKHASQFSSPENCNNECTQDQKSGWDFSDLATGSFSSYNGFQFPSSGGGNAWTCASSFGKRDLSGSLKKRTFDDSRCIKNTVSSSTPASIGCDSKPEGFSIDVIHVSVEFSCNLEFHYQMPDGSTCKHEAACGEEGTIVKNTQCGGAKGVQVYLGSHDKGDKDSCEIGFHSVGWDCNTKTKTVTSTTAAATSTVESSTEVVAYTTSTAVAESASSSVAYQTLSSSTFATQVIYSNTSFAAQSTAAASSTSEVSFVIYSTTEGSSGSTTTAESVASSSVVEVESSTSSAAQSTGTGSTGGYTPPSCLPSCMNTWLSLTESCKDNTDVNCYCSNANFTLNVIECVKAWATDVEIQASLSFLVGMCASYVPQNPGIVTNCPSTVTLGPTAPSYSTGGAVMTTAPAAASIPYTTVTYQTTYTTSGSTSTYSTTVTVPQVVFTTQTSTVTVPGASSTSQSVDLIPGTAAPASSVVAYTTAPPYPISSIVGTGTLPAGTAVGTGSATVTNPAQFTGAASSNNARYAPALFGAALAFLAL